MMWNNIDTGSYEGMIAETVTLQGFNGDSINAYYSRPLGPGPFPGIVLIPHMPGWDEWERETARRFTQHGYSVVCPDIYARYGTGNPAVIAKKALDEGRVHDDSVMGDTAGSLSFLKSQANVNGKVGVIGMCAGGRHAFLAACTIEGFDCAVNCWGGSVIISGPEEITPARPVAPIDYVDNLNIPLLGIFGNDDPHPDREEVNRVEAVLKERGKDYEFYRYDGAGHGIWYYDRPGMYRLEAAMDSWEKVFAFFEKNLR